MLCFLFGSDSGCQCGHNKSRPVIPNELNTYSIFNRRQEHESREPIRTYVIRKHPLCKQRPNGGVLTTIPWSSGEGGTYEGVGEIFGDSCTECSKDLLMGIGCTLQTVKGGDVGLRENSITNQSVHVRVIITLVLGEYNGGHPRGFYSDKFVEQ